jgi:ferritin
MSMAAYFESVKLKGFSHWMQAQVQEELLHVMRLFDVMSQMDARIEMMPIEAPPINWPSPQKVLEDTLKHNKNTTASINSLVTMARAENDQASLQALQWFVNKQQEQEQLSAGVLEKCKQARDTQGQKTLDSELGDRPWPFME